MKYICMKICLLIAIDNYLSVSELMYPDRLVVLYKCIQA